MKIDVCIVTINHSTPKGLDHIPINNIIVETSEPIGYARMKAIKQVHGKTIAQNEESCVVFGMPHAAIEMNVIDAVLPLEKIAEEIVVMVR